MSKPPPPEPDSKPEACDPNEDRRAFLRTALKVAYVVPVIETVMLSSCGQTDPSGDMIENPPS